MQLDLSGHHVEVTDSLRAYVIKKFERISRHFEQLIDVHCVLTVEKFGHKAEATLMLRGTRSTPTPPKPTCTLRSTPSPTSSIDASRNTRKRPPTITRRT